MDHAGALDPLRPVRTEVKGYKMDATAHHYFNNVEMAPASSKAP